MIPAKTQCPDEWTLEYRGYLMAERTNHKRIAMFECVDEASEGLPGTQGNSDGALFYHVISACGAGLPCPPFIKDAVIACVVCTK